MKLVCFKMQLTNIRKLLTLILVDWKDLNTTLLVYGSYKNKLNLYTWQILLKKDLCMLLKLGLYSEIVFLFKNNMKLQLNTLKELFLKINTVLTLIRFVV